MGLVEALENLSKRYESADSEQDLDAWDSDIDAVTDRYAAEYRRYAERFALAAQSIATDIPGLSADVYVEADADRTALGGQLPPPTIRPTSRLTHLQSRSGAPRTT